VKVEGMLLRFVTRPDAPSGESTRPIDIQVSYILVPIDAQFHRIRLQAEDCKEVCPKTIPVVAEGALGPAGAEGRSRWRMQTCTFAHAERQTASNAACHAVAHTFSR
jgi:hypothetical protein